KYVILVISSILVVVADQLTKFLVVRKFGLGDSIPIVDGFFNLTYIRNTGAAFGILKDAPTLFRVPFFIAIPFVALAAIAYIFRRIPDTSVKLALALALVVGGAIGNLIDRITLGYVVDFLDFHWRNGYHFPAFNVADSAICI